MNHSIKWLLIGNLLTGLPVASVALAQQPQAPDGIGVEKRSALRHLVPEETIEQNAHKTCSAAARNWL